MNNFQNLSTGRGLLQNQYVGQKPVPMRSPFEDALAKKREKLLQTWKDKAQNIQNIPSLLGRK